MTRFAPITADLLVRKGEARPWNSVGPELAKQPLAWEPAPAAATPRRGPGMHKMSLRLGQHDYERLGILAVKQGKTRQRLLQEAVGRLFTGMCEDYGSSCRCLGKSD